MIDTQTWGDFVRSAVHYSLIDGGHITPSTNEVFVWRLRLGGEKVCVTPYIEAIMDAQSVSESRDTQLE